MHVTETVNDGLKREFQVVVEASEIDAKVDSRLAELAPTMNLPGFRPGKVPASLLKKRYGKAMLGEILESTVNEATQSTLEERGLRAATQPHIEVTTFDEGQNLEYSIKLELMPDISPMDFSSLELTRPKAEPSDQDIDDALTRMAGEQKRSEPIKKARKSKSGDVLVLDFTGFIDGEAFEGGSAEGQQLELGSNTFIPGFEEQLIGVKAGDDAKVEVTFPEDYPRADYAGKAAIFETKIHEIREPVAVEIDDEFAKNYGLEDLAGLRVAIGQQIGQEFSNASRFKIKRVLLDKLADAHEFELPEGMLEAEYQQICQQARSQREQPEQQNGDANDLDGQQSMTAADEGMSDEDKAEHRSAAVRRVRLGLLLAEVGRLNNIQVADEEVQRAIMQQATRFPGQERQVVEFYQTNQEARSSVQAPLFEDKVVDFILEMAKIEDVSVAAEDLFRDEDASEVAADDQNSSSTKAKRAAKKAAPKKAVDKKTVAKKTTAKKPVAKTPAAKKPAAKTADDADGDKG